MKSTPLIITALILAFASTSLRADVTLGDATFNATSADVAENWLDPMPVGVTKTFEGFGANQGQTRTISFSDGGEVGGVKSLKRHLVDKSAPGLPGSTPTETTEDIWIAFDGTDNARVLKVERGGAVIFEATAAATPPLYLPADPQEGQSWEVAGTTVTLEQVLGSRSGYRLKVTYVNAAGESHSDYLHAGEGVVRTEAGTSGWQPKPTQAAE